MTGRPGVEDGGREQFSALPEPVPPEEWVETLDAATHPPLVDEGDARDRMLRSTNWP